jgi:hypothetical protein
MKTNPITLSAAVALLTCSGAVGCGVKAAPTPVLPSPPGPLQEEVENRALLRKEKEKERAKEKSAATEK